MDRLVPTLAALVLLGALTAGVLALAGVPGRAGPALAVLRAVLQLAAISFVLSGVITSIGWTALALAVMLGVASWTSARRLGGLHRWPVAAGAIAAGAGAALVVVFATGALEPSPRYLLAIGGITIGNAMALTTLSGRRFLEAAGERWDEVEGWLALGARPVEATSGLARGAVRTALVPTIDQTRTTGLVTLPGAFVGAIFGGLPPLEAGRFQVLVLASILAAGALAAVLAVRALAALDRRPGPASP
ncbi:ABC transporter permease [Amnibacterium endophyticum]|uniref:ABC transporter permease n=1 Tax=Amnibacterium endophyticum TaxID=2109337 RepID=A0ABW4LG99_9MICO